MPVYVAYVLELTWKTSGVSTVHQQLARVYLSSGGARKHVRHDLRNRTALCTHGRSLTRSSSSTRKRNRASAQPSTVVAPPPPSVPQPSAHADPSDSSPSPERSEDIEGVSNSPVTLKGELTSGSGIGGEAVIDRVSRRAKSNSNSGPWSPTLLPTVREYESGGR